VCVRACVSVRRVPTKKKNVARTREGCECGREGERRLNGNGVEGSYSGVTPHPTYLALGS
jgi:hypothetical protein